MKIFETAVGGNWNTWTASKDVKFSLKGKVLTMTTAAKKATEDTPGHDRLTTKFNLALLPVYTIG